MAALKGEAPRLATPGWTNLYDAGKWTPDGRGAR